VAGLGLALKEPKCFAHCVRNGPVQLEDVAASTSSQDNPRHWLSGASRAKFVAKVSEGHGFPALEFRKPFLDSCHRVGVRQDLGSLLQGVVLIDGDEHGRGSSPPGDDDVLAKIGDAIYHGSEVAAQRPYRDDFSHGAKCTALGTSWPFPAEPQNQSDEGS
jgi:hypothetical protein